MPETGDISALAVAVRQRRAMLGLTHEDVVNRGGPSGVTLTKIEAAKGPVPRGATLKKLDLALDWRPGSALRTLSGDKPTPIDDEPRAGSSLLPPPPQDLADEALQMAAHLVEAVEKLNDELPRLSDRAESAVVAILSVAMRLSDKGYDVRSGEMINLTGLTADPQGFLDAAAKNEGLLELRRMRAAKADQLLRRMFDAVHVGATRNALAHGRPVPPPPPALPAYSIDDDAAKAVTSLADRRKVPPPPSLYGLDVAASRREKQSDRDRDDEDGPHELSLFDKKSGRSTKYEFNSGAKAYEFAREFLIGEGEKPDLVDAALGDAGQHMADTSARGWGVRIRKVSGRAAASHDDDK
ncbi:helix-turn-helix domain-containing protein [Mycobacteroides chelonae]|uniref:helix-turn-helix domain-containing protein n=1 Tax=Mycobacteroides chelonae TaxID=1774 RepID=UPI001E5E3972|nr:helix-turn-helix domain-containing protein [Mycobacteroides chelonae]